MIEIPKNSQEKIWLQVTEFRGKRYADLRVHYLSDSDNWLPTRKGLTISPGLWTEFVQGIENLGKQMEEMGLLEEMETVEVADA